MLRMGTMTEMSGVSASESVGASGYMPGMFVQAAAANGGGARVGMEARVMVVLSELAGGLVCLEGWHD